MCKTFIKASELRQIVATQIGPYTGTVFSLYVADGDYYCPPVDDVEDVIHEAKVDQDDYIAEAHDCDDFARLLVAAFIKDAYREGLRRPAYCFGLIFTNGHAFNWFVDSNKNIQLVEPQTGSVFGMENLDEAVVFMLV